MAETSSFMTIDDIYTVLRKEILNLTLEPGSLLSENMVSTRFGISRTPTRSVFERLRKDGLIEVLPKKGSFVNLIDLDFSQQIIYMRIQVELAVMCWAARHPSPELLGLLKRNLAEQEDLVRTDVLSDDFYRVDSRFHQMCMQAAGKSKLWQAIQQMDVHYTRYRRMDYKLSEQQKVYQSLFEQHRGLYEAIADRRTGDLNYLLTSHLYSGFLRIGTRLVSEYSHYFIHGNKTIDEILLDVKMTINEARLHPIFEK